MKNDLDNLEEDYDEEEEYEGGSGSNIIKILVLILLIILVAIAGIFAYNKLGSKAELGQMSSGRGITNVDGSADDGALPFDDPEALREALQKKVDDSMLAIKINTNPVFATSDSEGNLSIENSERNNYNVQVEITLDEGPNEGSVIYTTPLMTPGQHILEDKLSTKLDNGEYPATAMFYAYDEEGNHMGQAGAGIKISIGQ